MEQFDIIKVLESNTKSRTDKSLLNIFKKIGYQTTISKRILEKKHGLYISFSHIQYPITISSFDELFLQADYLPGDLQRDIRTFYDNYKKFGLQKEGKNKNIIYYWKNISLDDYLIIIGETIPDRNIFKSQTDKIQFMISKNSKCEICGDSEMLCIDHWRAYSIYNIDSPDIAVLLCEKCNNIHHNLDASKLIKNYKDNLSRIKNWINIEKKIREKGYLPNESDIISQNTNIQFVFNHLKSIMEFEFKELLEMKI
jgi:hypothetical protein